MKKSAWQRFWRYMVVISTVGFLILALYCGLYAGWVMPSVSANLDPTPSQFLLGLIFIPATVLMVLDGLWMVVCWVGAATCEIGAYRRKLAFHNFTDAELDRLAQPREWSQDVDYRTRKA